MLRAILFGLCVGAGFQAVRNYPPDAAPTATSLLLVAAVAVACAYGVGRGVRSWRGPVATAIASARASAVADSTSSAAVQVNLWHQGGAVGGDRVVPSHLTVPDAESLEWIGHRQALQHQDLDGMDLSELVESDPESTEVDR